MNTDLKSILVFLSDLEYDLLREIIVVGLKAMLYSLQYNDEDLDLYNRIQLIIKELEYTKGYLFADPKTKNYEILAGIYELNNVNNVFNESVDLKLMKKQQKQL